MAKRTGMSPKTRVFVEQFAKTADKTTLDYMIGVAESLAQDSIDKGDMDEHMIWGEAFHTLRSEKSRRAGDNAVGYLETKESER